MECGVGKKALTAVVLTLLIISAACGHGATAARLQGDDGGHHGLVAEFIPTVPEEKGAVHSNCTNNQNPPKTGPCHPE